MAARSVSRRKINNLLVKTLLEGVYDNKCVLHKLRGLPHIVQTIWEEVRQYWVKQVQLPKGHEERVRVKECENDDDDEGDSRTCYKRNISEVFLAPIRDFHQTQYYKFPKPSKININMMPFIVGLTFEDCL